MDVSQAVSPQQQPEFLRVVEKQKNVCGEEGCWSANRVRKTGHGKTNLFMALIPPMLFLLSGCGSANAIQSTRQATPSLVKHSSLTQATVQAITANKQNQQTTAQLNALFTNLVAQETFSGSVLIARGGQVLLWQGYGMANWSTQTANTPQTRFYLGSVTKEFTAMALLLLQQQGKLNVKNSICVYVVPCPSPWQSVTLHEILTHTSGIPEPDTSQLSGQSPTAWIASFNNFPLHFTPGSEFDYCSVCYEILAYVVQVVSGQPYSQFVQNQIFTPLRMTSTGFDSDFFYAQDDSAHGYATWKNEADALGWQVSPSWSFLFGSGLLYSTITDLYRWDQALYTNEPALQQTRDQAFTSYTSGSLFAGSTYGYGWFITSSPVAGHRLIWHDGVIDGFRTYIGRYIDDDTTIIFLSNLATVDSPTLAQSIQKVVFANV